MSQIKKSSYIVSRRDFIKMIGAASGAAVLASCGKKTEQAAPTQPPPPPPPPTATKPPAPTATTPPEATKVPPPVATQAPTCEVDFSPTYPSFEKYDPPMGITAPFSANYAFMLEGEAITNNPMYNRIADNLGIRYLPIWQADGGEYYTRLNNDVAAGTLPDVFRCRNRSLAQFIDAGAIEDITDIFEATASDLVKQKKHYPDSITWNDVRRNGRLFGISYIEDGMSSDNITFIRSDWLEQVGLPEPKTLDEFKAVAKAFKEAGLCEFPIGICQNLVTWSMSVDPVFGAFGVIPAGTDPGFWIKGDDGKLRYGSLEPGAKDALAVLADWYKEELLDPDFISKDESGPSDMLYAGQLGIWWTPWWGGHAFMPDLEAAFPGIKVKVIDSPIGPTGLRGRAGTGLKGGAHLMKKGIDPRKAEAMIKHLNWQMELHVNWQQYKAYGEVFQGAGFFRGYEWDLDENCNLIPGKMPFTEWMYQRDLCFGYRGMCYPEWWNDLYQDVAKWQQADPNTLDMAQKWILTIPAVLYDMSYSNYSYATIDERIPNAFQGINTEAITNVLTDLLDLEHAYFLEFITGSRSLDEFDSFKEEWMNRGGTIYTEEVNKWAAENP